MAVKYFKGVTFTHYPEPSGTIGSNGRVVYIGPTGSDSSGNGTTASPYATLTKAYNSLTVDTENRRYIVFMDGIYTMQDIYGGNYNTTRPNVVEYRNNQGQFGMFGYTGAVKNVTIMSENPMGAKIFGSTNLIPEGIFGTGTSYERKQFSIPTGSSFSFAGSQYNTIFGSASISGSGLNAYQSFDIFGISYPTSNDIITPNPTTAPIFVPSMYKYVEKRTAAGSEYTSIPVSQFIGYSTLWSISRGDGNKYNLGLTYPIEWEGGQQGVGATMYWVKQRPIANGITSTYGPYTLPPEAGVVGVDADADSGDRVSWGITWSTPFRIGPNSSWGNYLWEAIEGISAEYSSIPGFTFAGMGMVFKGGNNNAEFSSILDVDPIQKRIRIDNGVLWGHTDPGRENLWGWDSQSQSFKLLNNGSGNEEELGEGGGQPTTAILFFGSPYFGGETFSWAFDPVQSKFFAKYGSVESGFTMAERLRIAPKVFTGSPTPNLSAFGINNFKDVDIVGFEIAEMNGAIQSQSSVNSSDLLSGNYSTSLGFKFNYVHDVGTALGTIQAQFNNFIGNLVARPLFGGILSGSRNTIPYNSLGSNLMHRNSLVGWRQESGLRNLGSQKTIWTNNIAYAPVYGNKTNGINQYSGTRDSYLANNFIYTPQNQALTINDIDPRSWHTVIENNLFHSFGTTYDNNSFAAIRNMKQVTPITYRNNVLDYSSLEGDPWVDVVSWWNICGKKFRNNVFPFSAPAPVFNRSGSASRRGSFLPTTNDDDGRSCYKVAGVDEGEIGWSDDAIQRGTLLGRGAWYTSSRLPSTSAQGVAGVDFVPGPTGYGIFVDAKPEYNNPTYYLSGVTNMPMEFKTLREKLAGASSAFHDYAFCSHVDSAGNTVWDNNLSVFYTSAEMLSGITIFPYAETRTTVVNKDASGQTLTFKLTSASALTSAQKATIFHAWNNIFEDPADGDYRLKSEYRTQNGITVGIDFKGPPVGDTDLYTKLGRWWFPTDDFDYSGNSYYVGTGDVGDIRINLINSPITVRLSMTNITEDATWKYRNSANQGYTVDSAFLGASAAYGSKTFTIPNSLIDIDRYCNGEGTPLSSSGTLFEAMGYATGYGGVYFDNTVRKTLAVDYTPVRNTSGDLVKGYQHGITVTELIKTFWTTGRSGNGTTLTFILHGKNDLDEAGYAEKKSSANVNTATYWTPEWYKVSSWLKFYSKEAAANEISGSTMISFRKSPHISYMHMDLDGMPPGFTDANSSNRPSPICGIQTGNVIGATFRFLGVTGPLAIGFFESLTAGTTVSINYGYQVSGNIFGGGPSSPGGIVPNTAMRYNPTVLINGITHGVTETQRWDRVGITVGLVLGETASSSAWSSADVATGSGVLLKFVSISSPVPGIPGVTVSLEHLENTSLITGITTNPVAGTTWHISGKIRPIGYTAGALSVYADPWGLRSNTNNPIWRTWSNSASQKSIRIRAEVPYNVGSRNLLAIENMGSSKKFFSSFGTPGNFNADNTDNLGIVAGDFIQVTGSLYNNGVYRVLRTYDGVPPQSFVDYGSATQLIDQDLFTKIATGVTIGEPFGKPKYQYLELHKPIVAEQAGTPITIKKVNHLPVLEVKYKA